jgi:hypothetical protein
MFSMGLSICKTHGTVGAKEETTGTSRKGSKKLKD